MLTYRSFLIVMLLASVLGAGAAMFADTSGEAVWFARVGSGGVFFPACTGLLSRKTV